MGVLISERKMKILERLWIKFLLILGSNYGANFNNDGFRLLAVAEKRASVLEEKLEFRIREGTEAFSVLTVRVN